MGFVVGVDTGGTFTDTVVIDEDAQVFIGKTPSTPPEFVEGVIASTADAAQAAGRPEGLLGEVDTFLHGTTIVVNAIVTGRGARIGLLTTRGFGDTIFMARAFSRAAGLSGERLHQFATLAKPQRVIPTSRKLVREIHERVDWKGAVVAELDEDHARRAIAELVDLGVDSLAVCLTWSFRNPAHEQRLAEIAAELAPEVSVTLSSSLVPKIGEYERMATTGFNAAMRPTSENYMGRLTTRLKESGLRADALIMQGNGGAMSIDEAALTPVNLVGSGPAGGLLGAKFLGNAIGVDNIICTDVGGTTFDVGLVVDGEPLITSQAVINQYVLHLPQLDVVSIGAGGGSIARAEVTAAGARLRVGPESAGANPGPVCYGNGGTLPTVTDADLVLGYLDAQYFLGGRMSLDVSAAREAIRTHVAEPLGLDIDEAAAGIQRVADSQMADLIRQVTVERGHDPRDFAAFLYGGGGPLHGTAYAAQLGLRSMIVPGGEIASVFSAWGIASADIHHAVELSRPMAEPFDTAAITSVFADLEQQAHASLEADGVPEGRRVLQRVVEMRYAMQTHELPVAVPNGPLDDTTSEQLIQAFERGYEKLFGRGSGFREAGIEMVTFRVHAYGQLAKPEPKPAEVRPHAPSAESERSVYWADRGARVTTPVYRGERLVPGAEFVGPAVVELPTTTVAVHPGQHLAVDAFGNFVITES